jgi:hypothetical protein
VATINIARFVICPSSFAYQNALAKRWMPQTGVGKHIPTTPGPFLPLAPRDLITVAGCTTGSPRPRLVPTFGRTCFVASDRCYREEPYQDRAFWHIAQTAYLCRCLGVACGSELSRTPYMRSSPTWRAAPARLTIGAAVLHPRLASRSQPTVEGAPLRATLGRVADRSLRVL